MCRFSLMTSLKAIVAASTIAILGGCSSASSLAIAPGPATPDAVASIKHVHFGRHIVSYDSCPATGPIKYVADYSDNVIDVFAGKFAGQVPCGVIAAKAFTGPGGLFVKRSSHDLYVANTYGLNVLVFHRGEMVPYNTYTDPTIQNPQCVAVANDGAVIASNETNGGPSISGSLSTWIAGPNGGTFIGSFPMKNVEAGDCVTVNKHGVVYFNDVDSITRMGDIWSVKCPRGLCGTQTLLTTIQYPGGLASGVTGNLIAVDDHASTVDTFEPPNPNPSTFPVAYAPEGLAINERDNHVYITENRQAIEYLYPSGELVGAVPCGSNCSPFGIAVDP